MHAVKAASGGSRRLDDMGTEIVETQLTTSVSVERQGPDFRLTRLIATIREEEGRPTIVAEASLPAPPRLHTLLICTLVQRSPRFRCEFSFHLRMNANRESAVVSATLDAPAPGCPSLATLPVACIGNCGPSERWNQIIQSTKSNYIEDVIHTARSCENSLDSEIMRKQVGQLSEEFCTHRL